MQNIMAVMQNAVPRRQLGIATATVQFFRSTGQMLTVAVMGTVIVSRLGADITSTTVSPAALADALQTVFAGALILVGLAALATLLLPHLPLRLHVQDEASARLAPSRAP